MNNCAHIIEIVKEKFINTKGLILELSYWCCSNCQRKFDSEEVEVFATDKHITGESCWCKPKNENGVIVHNKERTLH